MALEEQGRLNEGQYRQAQDQLDQEHREWIQKHKQKGEYP